jgi:nucleotide-binding universal stress UspA family protein
MDRRILVPIDDSDHSRAAFAEARWLAPRLGATAIDVVHVIDVEDYLPADPALERRLRSRRDIERFLGVADGAEGVSVWISFGDAVARILEQAEIGRHVLIVMGTQGRRGLRRVMLGSVAEAVLRRAPCPVLTVRDDTVALGRGGDDAAAGERRPRPLRILVPIDFSRTSVAALELALSLRPRLGAEITLLHAFQPATYLTPPGVIYVPGHLNQQLEQSGRHTAERHVEELLRSLGLEGSSMLEPQLRAGEPGEAILREAEEGGHDLVVMGTHGRTGIARVALGSVAERVLRRARCPVMTVRAPEALELVTATEPSTVAP